MGRDGAQEVLRDHWVVVEGDKIAAVTPSRPAGADRVYDRPGRFVLPGPDEPAQPLFQRGGGANPHREDLARLGILQLLKGGAATVMEPFRNGIPEMFDAALEMGIRFYGAPYLFSTADARADANGVVNYESTAASAEDGAADLQAWDRLRATWEGCGQGRIRLAMSDRTTA